MDERLRTLPLPAMQEGGPDEMARLWARLAQLERRIGAHGLNHELPGGDTVRLHVRDDGTDTTGRQRTLNFLAPITVNEDTTNQEYDIGLDWTEPTTWTPTDGSGAALVLTIGGTAKYVKLGKLVIASAVVTYPVTADGSNAVLGGLPFTSANNTAATQGLLSYTNEVTLAYVAANANAQTVGLYTAAGAAVTNATMSGNQLDIQIIYWTA